ncbi:trimeric intracellular cation channel family protein [Paenibacillus sp. MBLB4367]|uniref:trimeric intracellular cation channel family protein n=1 Tax=Paenibacillus sp. MBLB4367 TaxID=3384767 RepID=UPI003907F01A
MEWVVFSVIGTIAFALSGAIVAMEEDYDILGVFVLGLATAFGGGIIRNILIEAPVTMIWNQGMLLKISLVAMTILFFMPEGWIRRWKSLESFFDAIGLAAFAIQGALHAVKMGLPISAAMVAAVMTGTGGGIIRDVLAKRKPVVLRDEIYAGWAILAGLAVGFGIGKSTFELMLLFAVVVVLRMLSVFYKWRLPRRYLSRSKQEYNGGKTM